MVTRCKKCESTQTYLRLSSNERVCRSCGHIEKIEEKKTKVVEEVF